MHRYLKIEMINQQLRNRYIQLVRLVELLKQLFHRTYMVEVGIAARYVGR
jgi:hypothetical protein